MVGKHEAWLNQWVLETPTESQPLVYDEAEWGCGFELTLGQWCETPLPNIEKPQRICWEERQLVIKSHAFAAREIAGLNKRLNTTEAALAKLVLRPGNSRAKLETKVQQLLKKYRVAEFFDANMVEEVTHELRHVGRGRPGAKRPKREVTRTHLRLKFHRREEVIAREKQLAGWRIYVTNAPAPRLSLSEAVRHYRGQWQPERGFHRFKSGIVSALPIYLDDETRIRGLMLVLGLALRFLTLVEFVLRQSLVKEQTEVAGLYDGNPKRKTKNPTTERLLKAFANITLYCWQKEAQEVYALTPLSDLQKQLLNLMHVPETIYCVSTPKPSG
jgi:transposase